MCMCVYILLCTYGGQVLLVRAISFLPPCRSWGSDRDQTLVVSLGGRCPLCLPELSYQSDPACQFFTFFLFSLTCKSFGLSSSVCTVN